MQACVNDTIDRTKFCVSNADPKCLVASVLDSSKGLLQSDADVM